MKRSTLIILLIAAIGATTVYFLDYKNAKPRDEEPEKTRPAFKFTREEIASISIRRGGQTTNLENQNNKWVITQPVNAAADESTINALLTDLVNARIENEFPAPGGDLKAFGLTEPAVKLDVKLKNGQTHHIELGAKDPIGTSAYARINGSQNVATVSAGMLNDSDKAASDLRDRALIGAGQNEFSSVKVANESGWYELEKKDTEWTIKSPIQGAQGATDESQVSSLFSDFTG